MPDMSARTVCLWLKNDERLRSIPVIFISGLQGIEDKIEAFRVGAIDYISKPFQDQEMFARVKTHLELRRQQCELVSNARRSQATDADQVRVVTASQLATIFALAKLAEISRRRHRFCTSSGFGLQQDAGRAAARAESA